MRAPVILLISMFLAAASFAEVPVAPPSALDRLSAELNRVGVRRCAPIVITVAKFLIEGGNAGFRVKPLAIPTDTSPVVLTLESSHATIGPVRYATLYVSPQQSCSGYYEQSIYWAKTCAAVKLQNFVNFPEGKPLLRSIPVSDASQTVQLSFMPAGGGCVTIKKEFFK